MIKEALQFLLGKEKESVIRIHENEGLEYTNNDLKPILPPNFTKPVKLAFHTLTGLADYIKNAETETESVRNNFKWLRVKSYNQVYLSGIIHPKNFNTRFDYAEAVLDIDAFPFGQWLPLETFVIALQSQFKPCISNGMILDWLGCLANEHVVENKDDGFSQTIQVRTGITHKSKVKIENPIELIPYRTFLEVDQPISNCILRLKTENGFQCSLHIADGGMWKLKAIRSIAEWLEGEVGSIIKVIA